METDITARLSELREAARRIIAGEAPTEVDLDGAPTLHDWRATVHPRVGAVALEGLVVGHPLLGDRWVVTSPLVAIDPDGRWARTISRWYRLAVPATQAGHA